VDAVESGCYRGGSVRAVAQDVLAMAVLVLAKGKGGKGLLGLHARLGVDWEGVDEEESFEHSNRIRGA